MYLTVLFIDTIKSIYVIIMYVAGDSQEHIYSRPATTATDNTGKLNLLKFPLISVQQYSSIQTGFHYIIVLSINIQCEFFKWVWMAKSETTRNS